MLEQEGDIAVLPLAAAHISAVWPRGSAALTLAPPAIIRPSTCGVEVPAHRARTAMPSGRASLDVGARFQQLGHDSGSLNSQAW